MPAKRSARRTLETATSWRLAAAVTVEPCSTRRTARVTAWDCRPLMASQSAIVTVRNTWNPLAVLRT